MDKYSAKVIQLVKYICYVLAIVAIVIGNADNQMTISGISAAIVISVTVRIFFFTEKSQYKQLGRILPLFDLALIYWLILIDQSNTALVFLIVLVVDSTLMMKDNDSFVISGLSLTTYLVAIYYKRFESSEIEISYVIELLPTILRTVIILVFFFSISYLLKQLILQRETIKETAAELRLKSMALEGAYEKLKTSAEKIEEATILSERNKIAREIHDTVGHTLTTVLIEIEAGKRLLMKGNDLGYEKLGLAQGQVRKGLDNIRHSVKLLKEGMLFQDYLKSINLLVEETKLHTDVAIKFDYSVVGDEIKEDISKVVYSTIQESITNALKHGSSEEIRIELRVELEGVYLTISDNGFGGESLVPGFGLTAMRDRIEGLGGQVQYEINREGFVVDLQIPNKEAL